MSNAVLWQHVFQVVVCVLSAVQRASRTEYAIPAHIIICAYNSCILMGEACSTRVQLKNTCSSSCTVEETCQGK